MSGRVTRATGYTANGVRRMLYLADYGGGEEGAAGCRGAVRVVRAVAGGVGERGWRSVVQKRGEDEDAHMAAVAKSALREMGHEEEWWV